MIAGLVLYSVIAAAAHADTVVVTADKMIDVLAARVVDRPQVTIVDGRITAVGTQGAPCPPDRAALICRA
jgi:imidazolonepropionase-like amidohydrolase